MPEDRNRFVRKIVMCSRIVSPARKLGFVSFDTAFLNTASFVNHELQCFVLTNRLMIRRRTLNIKTPRNHHGTVTCCDTCDCSRARAVHFSRVGSHLARAPPCEPKRFPPRATLLYALVRDRHYAAARNLKSHEKPVLVVWPQRCTSLHGDIVL